MGQFSIIARKLVSEIRDSEMGFKAIFLLDLRERIFYRKKGKAGNETLKSQ